MKKVIESSGLVIIIFIFLLVLCGVRLDEFEIISLVSFATRGLKIIFAVAGFFLVSNNLYTKLNNRASMMATCYMLTSILIIINLTLSVMFGEEIGESIGFLKNNFMKSLLEIVFLIVCVNHVDEYCNVKYWIMGAIGITSLSIIISLSPVAIDTLLLVQASTMQAERIVAIVFMILLIMGWIGSKKKCRNLSRVEQRLCQLLYLNKMITVSVIIVATLHYSLLLNLAFSILDLLFYIVVFSYIDETTLSSAWKKIELDVSDREEEVSRKRIEKRILVASAQDVQKRIEQINVKAEILEKKINRKKRLQELGYIQKIGKNCHRLIKLSRNIVSLNKYEKGKLESSFERLDMVLVVGDVVSSIEPYLEEKELTLQYIVSDRVILCDIDREAIERILLNLISNSVKYSSKGGSIKVFLFMKKEQVYLVVQDTGVGIPQHLLNTVFSRFSRVESNLVRQQEGSGLGLTIVKSLVDLHHGEIEIKSKLNKGTSISIILPTWQDDACSDKQGLGGTQEELQKKVKIEFSDIGV